MSVVVEDRNLSAKTTVCLLLKAAIRVPLIFSALRESR